MPAERTSDEASLAEALGKLGARLDAVIGLLVMLTVGSQIAGGPEAKES